MKAQVGAFNQEKALVGAFSVIEKTDCETDGALVKYLLTSLLLLATRHWRLTRLQMEAGR